MPVQGNDNRSTVAWLPKASAAPAKKWNSTYGHHYQAPGSKILRDHEYWLRKAAQRVAAQTAAQQAEILEWQQQTRASQTFRDPNYSYSTGLRPQIKNPSSAPKYVGNGTLQAAPLHYSIATTSRRSHNSFDRATAQRYYAPGYSVPVLSVLEGQAAGAHTQIPLQATARPAARYPQQSNTRAPKPRPSTAGPLRERPELEFLRTQQAPLPAPVVPEPRYAQYDTTREYGNFDEQPEPVQQNGWTSTQQRPSSSQRGLTPVVRARSATYRPQLSNSKSQPTIPANRLLDVAAAPVRYQRQQAEYQGGHEEILEF